MIDPLDQILDTESNLTLRELTCAEDCERAIYMLQRDIDRMVAQIAKAEEDPSSVRPGWRTRVGSAIRWKKRSIKLIRDHVAKQKAPVLRTVAEDRQRVMLDTFRDELGDESFERIVAITKQRGVPRLPPLVEALAGSSADGG